MSHQHRVPPGILSHLQIIIVSTLFLKQSLLARQRTVQQLLTAEITQLHACSFRLYTPQEWETAMADPLPPCRGGYQHDHNA